MSGGWALCLQQGCWLPRFSSSIAHSETAPLVRNEQILIEYMEPRHPIFAYYNDPDDPAQAEEYQNNVEDL